MAGPIPAVDAVIFDCDGLLLDTESLWTGIEREWCERHGLEYTADVRRALMGTTPLACANILASLTERPGEEVTILAELNVIEESAYMGGISAMPGARALVDLVAARVPVYVASNDSSAALPRHLTTGGFADLADRCVGHEDVPHGKPAPDLYVEAARRVGVAPDRCAALEDSAPGMASAAAAGMLVIAVPSLPGEYEADWHVPSLEDPALVGWARGLGPASS